MGRGRHQQPRSLHAMVIPLRLVELATVKPMASRLDWALAVVGSADAHRRALTGMACEGHGHRRRNGLSKAIGVNPGHQVGFIC